MNKLQQLVFEYFDLTYSRYKKSGRRPVYMESPYVILEYRNDEGRVAFEYNTESNVLNFNSKDFYFVTNMFGLSTFDMANICKEYAYTKLNNPNILTSVFYNSRKNK